IQSAPSGRGGSVLPDSLRHGGPCTRERYMRLSQASTISALFIALAGGCERAPDSGAATSQTASERLREAASSLKKEARNTAETIKEEAKEVGEQFRQATHEAREQAKESAAVNQATRQLGAVLGVAAAVLLVGHAHLTRADFVPLYGMH